MSLCVNDGALTAGHTVITFKATDAQKLTGQSTQLLSFSNLEEPELTFCSMIC